MGETGNCHNPLFFHCALSASAVQTEVSRFNGAHRHGAALSATCAYRSCRTGRPIRPGQTSSMRPQTFEWTRRLIVRRTLKMRGAGDRQQLRDCMACGRRQDERLLKMGWEKAAPQRPPLAALPGCWLPGNDQSGRSTCQEAPHPFRSIGIITDARR